MCIFLFYPTTPRNTRTEVKKVANYRYLSREDRQKIEKWYLNGDRAVDIAARLGVHHTTIYKELKRGATGELDVNQREGYSAETAERRLRESFSRRGRQIKEKPPDQSETTGSPLAG